MYAILHSIIMLSLFAVTHAITEYHITNVHYALQNIMGRAW